MNYTFQEIEKMHYSEINKGADGEVFKPSDIIDLDEDEEDIVRNGSVENLKAIINTKNIAGPKQRRLRNL